MSYKVAIGSIPEKVCYVFSEEQEVSVGCDWDIDSLDKTNNKTIKVIPAYPVDDTDSKSKNHAMQWALYYNKPNYIQPSKNTNTNIKYDVIDNKPISGIKILSLERRGQGGRVYKVLIDKYYVDLREDVLVDAILQTGISAGGLLLGEYIWAKMSSQMRLVRIGSEVHRLIIEFDSKKNIKPIRKTKLEIGGVYQDRRKNKAIFIGYVNTTCFSTERKFVPWDKRQATVAAFDFKHNFIKKAMLFYEIFRADCMDNCNVKMKNKNYRHQYAIKKSHSYIEKIDQVEIDSNDVISNLKNMAIQSVKDKILEYTGHIVPPKGYAKPDSWQLEYFIEYDSEFLNLYKYKETASKLFDVKKLLLFS